MSIYVWKLALIEGKEEEKHGESYYGGGTKFTLPRLCPLVLSCGGSNRSKVELWKFKKIRWSRAYRVLVGKPEGKRPLGRPRRRWVDNIRMDLQEVWCGYIVWIGLARIDRWRTLVSAVMNLQVPWNEGNFLTSCKPVSFSRRTLHHGVSK